MEQKENNQDLLDRLDAVEAALDTLLNSITEDYNNLYYRLATLSTRQINKDFTDDMTNYLRNTYMKKIQFLDELALKLQEKNNIKLVKDKVELTYVHFDTTEMN